MSYTVAVRALCEFTARQGDLDLRFTPSPSSQEGMIGHALVASRRAQSYQSEVSLSGEYQELVVRGRADGYDPEKNQLEEVKTFRGDLPALPENHRQLHWAQVKLYGWLLCRKLDLAEVRLAVVYFEIASQEETPFSELFSAAALKNYFEAQCELFLYWARQEMAHRSWRDAALQTLAFPHDSFRPGQRDLAESVYRSAVSKRCLMVQAPTGIGKTMGTVFPLLKALPGQAIDKLFFLPAKTSGRRLALDALSLIKASESTLPLRVIELVARDKACEHPDKACHGDSCPLARGFYDRLPAAREAALSDSQTAGLLDKDALRAVALTYGVCPYYLAQDLVRWSDVVVGDYNYYFDVSAMLYALTVSQQWRVSVLVDEAHNLVERARKMYSAPLDQGDLAALRQSAAASLGKPLDRLHRAWRDLNKTPPSDPVTAYRVLPELPEKFLAALQQATGAMADELQADPARVDPGLQRFYFDALHFLRMAESFGEHSLLDVTLDPARAAVASLRTRRALSQLCIRNIVPASFLAPRFAAAHSVALFSATLSPRNYYADMLGLPDTTAWVDVQSPFSASQLAVQVVSNISTRFQHREQSLPPIAALMARQYGEKPGNYLVFLSSYDYLDKLARVFRARHPDIPVWEQTRRMDEAAREDFLARFMPHMRGIGFAVLGGAFGEGIDLPGDRLIGAFIATLGLPQVNPVNECIRQRMGENFGGDMAYKYAYLYPGVQKVVQAAGRVIRTPADQGVVYLMDDRFDRQEVRCLLPPWWQVRQIRSVS
ncbi:MAG: ATP-dependent DNA helicase [Polaromonas sp.]